MIRSIRPASPLWLALAWVLGTHAACVGGESPAPEPDPSPAAASPDVDDDGGSDAEPDPRPDAQPEPEASPDTDGGQANTCGDGTLQTFEACEGFELRGATCRSLGFSGGQLQCAVDCSFDLSSCSQCGNDVKEADEVCDGDDVDVTCTDLLGPGHSGSPTCSGDCEAVLTDTCAFDLPDPGTNASCSDDTGATQECADGLACLDTIQGAYCLEPCTVGATDDTCTNDTFCLDVGVEAETGACISRPTRGEVCTPDSGCLEGTCSPTFDVDAAETSTLATCQTPCGVDATGASTCPSGESCVDAPGGFIELQRTATGDAVDCTPATAGSCDIGAQFSCLETGSDAAGPITQCAKPIQFCAPVQDFYGFDEDIGDEHLCDRSAPTVGGRFCGHAGVVDEEPARVRCAPLLGDASSLGVCIGFCDAELNDGRDDLDCGAEAQCALPDEPQYFFPQLPEVPCGSIGVAACDADAGYTLCINFGGAEGPVCARPAKVCVMGDAP